MTRLPSRRMPKTALCLLAGMSLLAATRAAAVCPASEPERSGPGRLVCNDNTSPLFQPADHSLWGEIQPAETTLPADRDTTNFNEQRELYGGRNWFYDVAVAGHYLIAGLAHGIG